MLFPSQNRVLRKWYKTLGNIFILLLVWYPSSCHGFKGYEKTCLLLFLCWGGFCIICRLQVYSIVIHSFKGYPPFIVIIKILAVFSVLSRISLWLILSLLVCTPNFPYPNIPLTVPAPQPPPHNHCFVLYISESRDLLIFRDRAYYIAWRSKSVSLFVFVNKGLLEHSFTTCDYVLSALLSAPNDAGESNII